MSVSCDLHETEGRLHLSGLVGVEKFAADIKMIHDVIYVFTNVS